jgi:DNA-binding transcriptional regulator GbsR (MarR family)
MLQDKFKEYLDQAEVVKTLNADLRDASKSHDLNPEIEQMQKELKQIKEKLAAVTEIALIKEKRDGARERLNLLKDILMAEMSQAGEQEVTLNGKKAKIVPTMKLEKEN